MSTTVEAAPVDNSRLTDEELIRRTEELASDLRAKTADLIESLVEIDRRKLYRDSQCTSLFEYCVYTLRMSDGAAYRRIRAARAVTIYPPVGPLLRAGKLTLESLVLIHPFLNDTDAGKLVEEAAGKRVWEVERMVASRRTEAPRRDVVRFVPAAAVPVDPVPSAEDAPLFPQDLDSPPSGPPGAVPPSPSAPPNPADAAPEGPPPPSPRPDPGVRVAFTADAGFHKLLREAQAAMRHKYPDGRLDGVFRDALKALLRKKRPWAFPSEPPR